MWSAIELDMRRASPDEDAVTISRRLGTLCKSLEEHEAGDGLECLFEFVDGCSVSAAFFAEHPPGLQRGDGACDGGADGAELVVESGLGLVEVPFGRGPERDDVDAVNADVAEIGGGGDAGQEVL